MFLRGNLWKAKENLGFAWELNQRNENNGFVLEPIENEWKTFVVRGHRWQTQGKLRFCVGSYGKCKDNAGVAWEPIENVRKT